MTLQTFEIEVVGSLRARYSVEAKDLDSAHVEAAKRADNHLRDDGELIGVSTSSIRSADKITGADVDYTWI